MKAQGLLKLNYRKRYCNTERQVVDIKPGGNVLKYIQDCFEIVAMEPPVLRPSPSTSSCSSPDLSQDHFLPPSEKKKSPVLVNSVRSAFSATCSKPRPRETFSSGDDDVFLPNSPDEDGTPLGTPALLVEKAPSDPEVASPDPDGSLFLNSDSLALPSPHSELENEDEFLIAESFGDPSPSWLSQPKKNNLPKKRHLTSPLLGKWKAKEHSIDTHSGDHMPVVEQGNSFSKQPQSIVPTALQSSTSKEIKKQKCPKNVPPKKPTQRQRKNIKSSARDSRRKCRVLVLEESIETEPKGLCSMQAEMPPGDGLTPLGKRSAYVSRTFLVSPEDEHGRTLTQEGSCNSGEAVPSMEQQNSRTLSERCSFVRAINMNDLSGPVYSQNDKVPFEREVIRGKKGESFLEPSVALQEDLVLLPSDSLKDKVVRLKPHLRRSKRMRLKPLEYWRGERVMYKVKSSGGFVASGIISPKPKEPCKRNRTKQATKMDLEKMLGNANPALKDPSEPAHVFDAASKQEVLQECVNSGHSHLLFFNNEDVSVYKYFSTPIFSTGKLILKPFKEKGSQYSHTDTLVFHIVKGRLLFTLYGQCYPLCTGNYFYVPAGNVYNIQNISNEECILVFTHIKGNRLEGE
ncbi:centromere protein C [Heteronotia binoei]|uniref:centromere protein C n=1 Tax=Heteronotia binoei TaxID=13085 RepID=UPI002930A2E3|nr:centromere protein C [Heteronotia binoei]